MARTALLAVAESVAAAQVAMDLTSEAGNILPVDNVVSAIVANHGAKATQHQSCEEEEEEEEDNKVQRTAGVFATVTTKLRNSQLGSADSDSSFRILATKADVVYSDSIDSTNDGSLAMTDNEHVDARKIVANCSAVDPAGATKADALPVRMPMQPPFTITQDIDTRHATPTAAQTAIVATIPKLAVTTLHAPHVVGNQQRVSFALSLPAPGSPAVACTSPGLRQHRRGATGAERARSHHAGEDLADCGHGDCDPGECDREDDHWEEHELVRSSHRQLSTLSLQSEEWRQWAQARLSIASQPVPLPTSLLQQHVQHSLPQPVAPPDLTDYRSQALAAAQTLVPQSPHVQLHLPEPSSLQTQNQDPAPALLALVSTQQALANAKTPPSNNVGVRNSGVQLKIDSASSSRVQSPLARSTQPNSTRSQSQCSQSRKPQSESTATVSPQSSSTSRPLSSGLSSELVEPTAIESATNNIRAITTAPSALVSDGNDHGDDEAADVDTTSGSDCDRENVQRPTCAAINHTDRARMLSQTQGSCRKSPSSLLLKSESRLALESPSQSQLQPKSIAASSLHRQIKRAANSSSGKPLTEAEDEDGCALLKQPTDGQQHQHKQPSLQSPLLPQLHLPFSPGPSSSLNSPAVQSQVQPPILTPIQPAESQSHLPSQEQPGLPNRAYSHSLSRSHSVSHSQLLLTRPQGTQQPQSPSQSLSLSRDDSLPELPGPSVAPTLTATHSHTSSAIQSIKRDEASNLQCFDSPLEPAPEQHQ